MFDERQIVTEATHWFVQLLEPDAPPDTQQEFSGWMRQSPQHAEAYLTVVQAWACLKHVNDPTSAAELIQAARQDDSELAP